MWWTLHRDEPYDGAGVLTTWERSYVATLSVPARRRDFVHGRWVAKCLLAAHLEAAFEQSVGLDAIEVERDADGVPRVHVRAPWLAEPAFSLSLSHRRGVVLAASMPGREVRIGADVEVIEPRTRALIEDFFVAEEVAAVDAAAEPGLIANTIWSSKEAVLKALHLGLSVDTRRVRCSRVPVARTHWQEVGVDCDLDGAEFLRAWCRRHDDLVLTLAVVAPTAVDPTLHEHIIPPQVVHQNGEVHG